MNDIRQLFPDYHNQKIPDELEGFVRKTIIRKEKQTQRTRVLKTSILSLAGLAFIFVGIINFDPAAAGAMSKIPLVRNLVNVVLFREWVYRDGKYTADVKVPQVDGLAGSGLGKSLNQKYLDENTRLYSDFLKDLGQDSLSPQILALYTNFKIKTNTEDFLAIERIKTEIGASGAESVQYDNIDLNNQIIVTLPSLFKDDSYIEVISSNIKEQMRQQMAAGDGRMYFIEGDGSMGGFSKIKPDQPFYIDSDSKLVIVFNEYEVAPGAMGIVEFVIPTEAVQGILVSNAYIR